MTDQLPDELEQDGWHTDEIHEAVLCWCELGVFEKSHEHGLVIVREMVLHPE